MSWQVSIKGDPISWLLKSANPGVRYLALRDLLDRPADDPELSAARRAAHAEGPIATILAEMQPEGYWMKPGAGYGPKYFSTVWAMITLAQLGASLKEDERVARACAYVLDHALTPAGQFSAGGPSAPSSTVDCLQGNLSWALLEMGVEDERLDCAFEWMARTVTGEGLSPRGDKNASLRYYAYNSGPLFACGGNTDLSCAWGAAKVLLALGRLPAAGHTPLIRSAIQQGVDFLFSVDPTTGAYPIGLGDKPSRNWWKFGFPVYYITDLLQIAEVLSALGCVNDPRLSATLEFIRQKQDANGRWPMEYHYNGKTLIESGAPGKPNPWVTLRALRVLKQV
jgi:hypothetical protein